MRLACSEQAERLQALKARRLSAEAADAEQVESISDGEAASPSGLTSEIKEELMAAVRSVRMSIVIGYCDWLLFPPITR